MKFLKRLIIFSALSACLLSCCGCGDKDLRIFKKDITATVDGQEQPLVYVEAYKKHKPRESNLAALDGASNIYFSSKDQAMTISEKSHEVDVTFADVKPVFREEDVRFMTIGRDSDSDPDDSLAYGEVPITLPITNFQSKKGKLSFQFEIDSLFDKGTVMFCIAIWYDYDSHNIFIPMNVSAELVGDHEFDSQIDDLEKAIRKRPNYID